MSDTLETLADKIAIIDLTGQYNRAFDEADAQAWAGTFTDDGVLDSALSGATTGRHALVAMCTELAGTDQVGHVITTDFTISVDQDRAVQTCTGVILNGPNGDTVGRYDDQLIRTADGWRFTYRKYTPLSTQQPISSAI
jgi:hypothetical protein